MSFAAMLLPEYDMEMSNTRKTLERVPEGKNDWTPHEKSMALGRLAGHVAEIPQWAAMTFNVDELDIAPVGGEPYQVKIAGSREELLATFDCAAAAGREALAAAADEDFGKPWSLLAGGNTIFTMPKGVVLRAFVLSHMIHHRAQLGVYLRLLGVPVPSIYGPSADEGQM